MKIQSEQVIKSKGPWGHTKYDQKTCNFMKMRLYTSLFFGSKFTVTIIFRAINNQSLKILGTICAHLFLKFDDMDIIIPWPGFQGIGITGGWVALLNIV